MTEPLLEFPCAYSIKAIGRDDGCFVDWICEVIDQHASHSEHKKIKTRASKSDNYIAVTVSITAENQAELDAIYQVLSTNDKVVMAL